MITEVPKDSLPPPDILDFPDIFQGQVESGKDLLNAVVRYFSCKVSLSKSAKTLWKEDSKPDWWSAEFRDALDKADENIKASQSFKYSYVNTWKNPTATTEDSVPILEIKMTLLMKHLAMVIPLELKHLCNILKMRNVEEWKSLYDHLCLVVQMNKAERLISKIGASRSCDDIPVNNAVLQRAKDSGENCMRLLGEITQSQAKLKPEVSEVQWSVHSRIQESRPVDLKQMQHANRLQPPAAQSLPVAETGLGPNSPSSAVVLGPSRTEVGAQHFATKGLNIGLRVGRDIQDPSSDLDTSGSDHCMKSPEGSSILERQKQNTPSVYLHTEQNGQLALSQGSSQAVADREVQISALFSDTHVQDVFPTKEVPDGNELPVAAGQETPDPQNIPVADFCVHGQMDTSKAFLDADKFLESLCSEPDFATHDFAQKIEIYNFSNEDQPVQLSTETMAPMPIVLDCKKRQYVLTSGQSRTTVSGPKRKRLAERSDCIVQVSEEAAAAAGSDVKIQFVCNNTNNPSTGSQHTWHTSPEQQHIVPTSPKQQHMSQTIPQQQHMTHTSPGQQHMTKTSLGQQHMTQNSVGQQHMMQTSPQQLIKQTHPGQLDMRLMSAGEQHMMHNCSGQQGIMQTSDGQQHITHTSGQQHITQTSPGQQYMTHAFPGQQKMTETSPEQQYMPQTYLGQQHMPQTSFVQPAHNADSSRTTTHDTNSPRTAGRDANFPRRAAQDALFVRTSVNEANFPRQQEMKQTSPREQHMQSSYGQKHIMQISSQVQHNIQTSPGQQQMMQASPSQQLMTPTFPGPQYMTQTSPEQQHMQTSPAQELMTHPPEQLHMMQTSQGQQHMTQMTNGVQHMTQTSPKQQQIMQSSPGHWHMAQTSPRQQHMMQMSPRGQHMAQTFAGQQHTTQTFAGQQHMTQTFTGQQHTTQTFTGQQHTTQTFARQQHMTQTFAGQQLMVQSLENSLGVQGQQCLTCISAGKKHVVHEPSLPVQFQDGLLDSNDGDWSTPESVWRVNRHTDATFGIKTAEDFVT